MDILSLTEEDLEKMDNQGFDGIEDRHTLCMQVGSMWRWNGAYEHNEIREFKSVGINFHDDLVAEVTVSFY